MESATELQRKYSGCIDGENQEKAEIVFELHVN